MSVWVAGDIHGTIDIGKLNSKRWPEKKALNKKDTFIQLGDFGVIFDNVQSGEERYWIRWFDAQPYTTAFVPGNHENWDRLMTYPLVPMFGGMARKISDSIYMLERAGVYVIDGKKFFAFGGALSIDASHRTEGVSWWRSEVHSHEDQERALDMINEHRWFDFIVTHTCPTSVAEIIIRGKVIDCPTSKLLEHIARSVKFGEWHFGHLHEDRVLGKYFCHYNNKPMRIVE